METRMLWNACMGMGIEYCWLMKSEKRGKKTVDA